MRSKQGWSGRFTTDKNAQGVDQLTIDIVAVSPPGEPLAGPGFQPAVITGSAGQVLHVTLYQAKDASANFQHNFSIDPASHRQGHPAGCGQFHLGDGHASEVRLPDVLLQVPRRSGAACWRVRDREIGRALPSVQLA